LDERWIKLTKEDLAIELEQAKDEGRSLDGLMGAFHTLQVESFDASRAEALLDSVQQAELSTELLEREPSELEDIQAVRKTSPGITVGKPSDLSERL
jgi:hypothetical protein